MDNVTIRPWRTEDRPRLVELWQTGFGDDQKYIDTYHSLFLKPDKCIVAEADGRVVSAMYIMNGPLMFPPSGQSLSTAYAYALATDPAYRGRGIGTAVYKACVSAAMDWVHAVCVLPSEPGLYGFYERAVGCVPASFIREAVIPRAEAVGPVKTAAEPISAGEYYLRRKALLRGRPYAVMGPDLLSLEALHMRRFGGGLLDLDGDIAAVEMDGDTCRVLELLAPEGDWADVLASVAARFPAEDYAVRTPLFFPGPGQTRPFVLAALNPELQEKLPDDLWWGFAFD